MVGDKLRDKLRAHIKLVQEDVNGRADWFAKRNEKAKREHIERETTRIRELSPMMNCPESGRQIPAYNYEHSFWYYFQ